MPRTIQPRAYGKGRPSFELLSDTISNGVEQLNPALTINGTTMLPMFRYNGKDATVASWAPWGYGETLLQADSGTDPSVNQGSPLLGSLDGSIQYNAGDVHQASNATFGQIGTEDIVAECVFRPTATSATYYASTRANAGIGWILSSDTRCNLFLADASGSVNATSATLIANHWYHLIFFADRSGSCIGYLNAIAGTAIDISGRPGSLTSTNNFTMGSNTVFVNKNTMNIAYCSMWKGQAWLDTHLQATVAAERFYRLCGIWPSKAKGTAAPTVYTRATTASLDKIDPDTNIRSMFSVGSGWPRMCSRKDSAGTLMKGFLPETANTNLCLQSAALGTTWTKIDAGDAIGGSVTPPDGSTNTAAGIIGDSTDGQHGVTQDITLTAASYSLSCWAKKGDKDWLYLADTTVANCSCYFNLATGTVGTAGAGAVGYISAWGNDWYRCGIVLTGTVAAHTIQISPAHADTDNTYAGDGATVNTSVWGVQMEASDFMTSYIPTTTASATRNADILNFKTDDGNIGGVGSNGKGVLDAKILLPNINATQARYVASLSDGGSSSDRILLWVTDGDVANATIAASGGAAGSVGGNTDIVSGVIKNIETRWATNSLKLFINNVSDGTEDTTVGIPDELDRLNLGSSDASVGQLNGLISDVRVSKK